MAPYLEHGCGNQCSPQVVAGSWRAMSLRLYALLAVFLVTMQQTEARLSQRAALILPFDSDFPDPMYDPQTVADPQITEREREMNNLMVHWMQTVAHRQQEQQQQLQEQEEQRQIQQQQQQQQQKQHEEEVEQELNQAAPVDEMFDPQSDAEPLSEKRGSYMSLCHFKVCNMGKKRNLRRSQGWSRI